MVIGGLDWLKIFLGTVDRPSPSDIFTSPEFMWTPGAIYLDNAGRRRVKKYYCLIPFEEDPFILSFEVPPTRSEDPIFDKHHHTIYLDGATPEDHRTMVNWLANEWFSPPPGEKPRANLIAYQVPGENAKIHRLQKIQFDSQGRKWWFKGDNNVSRDPIPARDEHIWWVCATIVY